MKKFIRVISPFSIIVILIMDIATIAFGAYAIEKLIAEQTILTIAFVAILAFALIVAILTTKESLSNGVRFTDEQIEFTGLDTNNIFRYNDIVRIESQKDTTASLKKNFVDRYSRVIIYLKDDSVVTIDLGQTTKRTLKKITTEIEKHI